MPGPYEDSELVLAQFNKLINELLRGTINRNCFRPWEIAILLDIENCNLRDGNKKETLRRYQKFVQRQMERGAASPVTLSSYLSGLRAKREAMAVRHSGGEHCEKQDFSI
ncbi:MAG: hypothetical protein IANPNBLG_04933 [Bryobacteraceae bacterium]|nr:hypothetical protein [Bryobacteraceae bacterium]MCZ2075513.1 hypothetical protein [Bryobacterales bacterium]